MEGTQTAPPCWDSADGPSLERPSEAWQYCPRAIISCPHTVAENKKGEAVGTKLFRAASIYDAQDFKITQISTTDLNTFAP